MKCFNRKVYFVVVLACGIMTAVAQDDPSFIPGGRRIDTSKNQYKCQFNGKANGNITDFNNGRFSNSQLFTDIDMSAFELVSTHVRFQEKDNVQKLVLSPMRLLGWGTCNPPGSIADIITDLKINLTQTTGNTVLGFGMGFDNSSPRSKRSRRLTSQLFDQFASPDNSLPNESFEAYKKRVLDGYEKKLDSLALDLYEARAKSVFTFNFAYNQRFFSVLNTQSDIPLVDSLNYYGTESNVWSVNMSYARNIGSFVVSAGYNHFNTRQSAVKGQEKVPFRGLSFSVNKRLVRFIPDKKKLRKTEAYQQSLFVPGLHVGVIYEQLKTNSTDYQFIKDKRISREVITPMIEILIAPAAQFRLGFPITKDKLVTDVKTSSMGASIAYVLKLSNLSK
ncbi:hypothetical protein [Phnomibacter ginsenosidimutans]|uniref:Uncharacterized protein n=1 Tax=Phnomibacter ginsenosidimutans TaxID=2676868 RepID=A0A6I6GKC6_9BACT|nr:hypothetical protein [Phnomibacter ginsenosidimutans]QGW28885.1 hypothetical protein GLV81_12965 [Phnomibacter ginsenosidimutans]